MRREYVMSKNIYRVGIWSMKHDRELMSLSKTITLEAISAQIQRPPLTILKAAKRLGLTIKHATKT
jgi:hypothetical protein